MQFVDPQTGEFDFKLHIMSREEKADLDAKMAAGELPYAMSLDDLVAPDKDASAVAGAAGGISQFLGAYLGIGKLFRVGSGFTGAMTQGAAADFLAFDGSDKAVTDMLLDMGWIEPNMITELLKKDPTDPDYVGRFQAAVEGAGLGAVIEKAMIPVLGLAFRAIKDKDVPVDAARQAIQQGKLMMQGALLKAGQNAELRIKERGTGTTMMSGVDPTIATDPLVAAAGRAVGGDLSKQVDDARIAYEASPNDAALRKNYFELRRQRDADPVAKVEPPTDDTPGIIAFHGSAADFDGFKLEKIGTGEGAQAYGYGLYFADKEDIAKYYRDFLSKSIDVDGKPFIRGNNIFDEVLGGDQDLADNLGATQGDLEQAIKEAKETRQEMLDFGNEEAADIYADELYKLEQLRGRVTDNSSKGHMYKVGLVPKPDEMLDYYKPLSEQPDNIQAAYKKAYHNKFIKGDADLEVLFANPNDLTMQDMGIFDKSTGAQAYRELADKLGSIDWPVGADAKTRQEFRTKGEAAASKALFEAGIPGIKFLDNSARKTSGTSSNYVIFDDSMIKILEKYGIVGPVAISAMALSEDES